MSGQEANFKAIRAKLRSLDVMVASHGYGTVDRPMEMEDGLIDSEVRGLLVAHDRMRAGIQQAWNDGLLQPGHPALAALAAPDD